jgi:ATP-dependent RNA/DNA helicase IGHMBP2
MAVSRYCPHGNLRASCPQCRLEALSDANVRAAQNRARGESGTVGRIEGAELPYPWQRESFQAWLDGGRTGLIALSLGLPTGDLPYAVMAELVNASPTTNVLVACAPNESEELRRTLAERFGLNPTGLVDHHFLEPRNDGTLVVADLQELETVDLSNWGRFASTGLLLLLDADGVTQGLGQHLTDSQFRFRFCLSRQPSAIDLLSSRPWSRAFGPVLFRSTEVEARDLGILPRIHYRLHVEMLKPEPKRDGFGPEGPWEATDIPTRLPALQAGPFVRSRARDVATRRAGETPGLVVIHDGVPVPGAAATVKLADLPDKHESPPAGWVLASPTADGKAILRLATVAFKTLTQPGHVEDAVVLPVPVDLCKQPPWSDAWRMAANQIDRVAAGLLLATDVEQAMMAEDLESLVGVALALRGIPAEELYHLSPIVSEAALAAHGKTSISPDRVQAAARGNGGLAAALLVAAELGPLHLLRIAHPRFTPVVPDLPHPSLYDARRHAWRGRAFAALASAAKGADLVTAWGRYPELRFVFPSSALLEASTAYCAKHKLRGPLDEDTLHRIDDKTKIGGGDRRAAADVLAEWNSALILAEEHEREFLADMHARQPERERRREGVALPNVAIVNRTPDSLTLEANEGRFPPTNIAPGSEVALVEQGEREELARGVVGKISRRTVTIDFPAGAPRHRMPTRLTVNLVFDTKVFEAYHSAVMGAQRALSATTPVDDGPDGLLRACVLGETDPPESMRQVLKGGELTDSQRTAINQVLSGGRVRLIHGPPGTGKTHTLVHLAMALARAGHSVLVTADSNAAVDNLVVGLRRAGSLAVRVGHAVNLRDEAAEAARIDPMEAPPFVRWAGQQGIIVATTNYGAFRYIDPKGGLSPYIFDYVIHDEAGQATAPSSLAAVMRGRRLVLAGDPKQLPPTVVSMDAKEAGLDVTLFERIEQLTGAGRTRMLETQFRMREPIVAFSNKRYYEGRIKTDAAAAAQDGLPGVPAAAFQHVTGRENERARNGSISNDQEIEAVVDLVQQFAPKVRERGWTMAVLTPYQAQREQIRRRLPDIEVSTVDGAQGREWDVVLYSTVRSNPQHRLGFLEDERRLNVAVTRARRNFVLVGDERTLHDHPAFGELLGSTEKVRLHYPPQPQQGHGGRGNFGGRGRFDRDDRRGGGRHDRQDRRDRRDDRGPPGPRQGGGPPQRQPPPPPRPRPQDPRAPRIPDSFQDGEVVRDEESGPPAQLPSGAIDPGLDGQGGGGRRRRRRRRGRGLGRLPGDDEPERAPLEMPDLPSGPRPERRRFVVGDAPADQPPTIAPAPPPAAAAVEATAPEPGAAMPARGRKAAKKEAKPTKAAKPAKPAKPVKAAAAKPAKGAAKASKATPKAKAATAKAKPAKCAGATKTGSPCKLKPVAGSAYCAKHAG